MAAGCRKKEKTPRHPHLFRRLSKTNNRSADAADPAPSPADAADAWHARADAALAALAGGGDGGAVQAALDLDAEAGGLGGSLPPAGAARLKRAADGLRAAAGAARAEAAPAFAFPAAAVGAVLAAAAPPPVAPPAPALPPPPPPPAAATVAGLTDTTLVLGPAALGGRGSSSGPAPVALTLAGLARCTVILTPAASLASLTVTEVEDCRVVVGVAGAGSGAASSSNPSNPHPPPRTVMIDGASRCSFWLAAGQVRVHRASACDLYTRGSGGLGAAAGAPAPVLEGCAGVRVAPYAAPGEESGGADDDLCSPWAAPQDFDWPRAGPSPHWSVLGVGERVAAPDGGGVAEAAELPS